MNYEYQYVSFRVEQCSAKKVSSSSIICKSQSEIDAYFSQLRMKVQYSNTNLNLQQFNEDGSLPAEYYLDEPVILQLNPTQE